MTLFQLLPFNTPHFPECGRGCLTLFVFELSFISAHVDNCKKLGLVFENVVGIFEIINSRDIQLQVRISTSF